MDGHGFHLAGVYNQHVDAIHGPIQADFLFARPSAAVTRKSAP